MTRPEHRNPNAVTRNPATTAPSPTHQPPSHRQWLDQIGGESIHGSGFENETPAPEFAEQLPVKFTVGNQGGRA